MLKVVFHVDESAKWQEAYHNIKNLLHAAPEVKVVLLVNGSAIKGYLDAENQEFLALSGVTFHACANAMRANQITADQLPENVEVVPAGVLDLIQLQNGGYAYIKP